MKRSLNTRKQTQPGPFVFFTDVTKPLPTETCTCYEYAPAKLILETCFAVLVHSLMAH